MSVLEDYRHKPGSKLRTEYGTPIVVLELATGMIGEGGRPSGGDETVAVMSMDTGKCSFVHGETEVVEGYGWR